MGVRYSTIGFNDWLAFSDSPHIQRLAFWLSYRQHFVEAYERGPYG